MNKFFTCDNKNYSRLWHCFGNSYHLADIYTITEMIKASDTNVIPVNTHRLTKNNKNGLEIGYAGIPLSKLKERVDLSKMHKMLNINLQTTAKDAYEKTKLAYDMSGEEIIKLEVLHSDHKNSNQDEIITASELLIKWRPSLNVYPLFANDLLVAKKLIDAGCTLLRVMGSSIGSCKGIENLETLSKICELGVPVVLDGGIGSVKHAEQALKVGVQGILVNSMLFEQKGKHPAEVLKEFANIFK